MSDGVGLHVLGQGVPRPALEGDVGGLHGLAPGDRAVEHGTSTISTRAPLIRDAARRSPGFWPIDTQRRDAAAATVVDQILDRDGRLHIGRDHQGRGAVEHDRERANIQPGLRFERRA